MDHLKIAEVGINSLGQIYVGPEFEKLSDAKSFVYVYRPAMDVSWNDEEKFFHSPKPNDMSYLGWFQQILKAVQEELFCILELTEQTKWQGISAELKTEIQSLKKRFLYQISQAFG